jgi:hypothetical protein
MARCFHWTRGYDSHQEVYQSPAYTALDNSLDFVVGTVRKVRQRPTRVDENFIVERVDELGEDGKGRGDEFPVGLRRLSSAKVGEGPGGVSEHGKLVVLVQQCQKRRQSSLVQTVITVLGGVSGNVTEGPDAGILGYDESVSQMKVEEVRRSTHACSLTSELAALRSWMKYGTAPALMTTCVCSEVPEAMSVPHDVVRFSIRRQRYKAIYLHVLVKAHAASNWSMWLSDDKKATNRSITLQLMTWSIGGFFSFDNILRDGNEIGRVNCILHGLEDFQV